MAVFRIAGLFRGWIDRLGFGFIKLSGSLPDELRRCGEASERLKTKPAQIKGSMRKYIIQIVIGVCLGAAIASLKGKQQIFVISFQWTNAMPTFSFTHQRGWVAEWFGDGSKAEMERILCSKRIAQ